jgi:D-inositol-3-phosphate glycosyltransferase
MTTTQVGTRGPAGRPAPHALLTPPRRICMLSVHTCPLAAPGGKETGGMNVYVRELARVLGRRGYKVDAFTRSQSSAVPHVPDSDLGPNVRVIHVVSGPEAPLSKAAAWEHRSEFVKGVRAFVASQGTAYDLYHAHYWMSGWVAQELRRWRPAPVVQMFHTLGARKDAALGEGAEPEIAPRRAVETELMRASDALVASTLADRDDMVHLYGADPAKIAIVPPGVDLELFRPIPQAEARRALGQDPEHRMILFVGRMDPIKGLDTLVRAMALVVDADPRWRDNACLCVIGGDRTDDPARMDAEMARIHALRVELGLGDVVNFLGPQPQDLLPLYYSAAQVVVVPSRYESFGMVALEAMACGTPVIASEVGGLSTLVRDGRTGFLVPDGNPQALADRLRPLLGDSALRATLGSQGVATAESYTWPAIAERMEVVYDAVLTREVVATAR